MNRIIFEPFRPDRTTSHAKEIPLTPRALAKKKHNISNVNKLRSNKQQPAEREETLNFDDTFCFRENNRQLFSKQDRRQRPSPQKKCMSQLLNVKMVSQIRKNRKGQLFSSGVDLGKGKNTEGHVQFNPFEEVRIEGSADRNKRNKTSYSARKKYQTIKPQAGFISQRTRSNGGTGLHQSTLVPKINPESLPYKPHQNYQALSVQKIHAKNKYLWMMNKTDPLKLLAPERDKQAEPKKVNYYQYSIIRPDQIKSLTLLQRQEEKELIERRNKQQKILYLQMLQQLKMKDQLVKRNAKMKEQIKKSKNKQVKLKERSSAPTLVPTRRNHRSFEQKDEVRPWDVEVANAQPHITDIL